MPAEERRETTPRSGAERRQLRRFAPLAVIAAVTVLVLAMGWHRELSLENVVRHRTALDAFVAGHLPAALASFAALYVAVVALSIPGAGVLSIASGVLFGIWLGGLASIFAATVGAIIIFLIARTAFGEHLLRRAGPLAARLVEGFRQDAFSYLLFLRLVPVFPFFVINLVAALAGVRLAPFIAATAVGIVPAAFVLASVGAGLDSVIAAQETAYRACLQSGGTTCRLDFDFKAALTPQLIAALVALGVLALVPIAVKRLRVRRAVNSSS
jgi:uncharacterized membrane protein YdjX (TVP38/TMEM64 family)